MPGQSHKFDTDLGVQSSAMVVYGDGSGVRNLLNHAAAGKVLCCNCTGEVRDGEGDMNSLLRVIILLILLVVHNMKGWGGGINDWR